MRLTEYQAEAIRKVLCRHFGQDARVFLFGSRVDDSARGADIDLFVEADMPDESLFLSKMHALEDLHRALGERKIDIVISRRGKDLSPVAEEAVKHGVAL